MDRRNDLPVEAGVDNDAWIWFRLNSDLIITGATIRNRIGRHVYEYPGVEDVWGRHYTAVLETGRARRVREFWRGGVWEALIAVNDERDGLYVEAVLVDEIKKQDLITLKHHAAALTRVLASLEADVKSSGPSPSPVGASASPHGIPRLRVLPSPPDQ